jgi:hypothetical protein
MNDAYVPIDDLAKHLCVKVSTVRSWVQKRYIPENTYIKVGSTYRFNIPAVVAGLKGEKVENSISDDIKDIVDEFEDAVTEPLTEQLNFDFDEDDDL